MRVARGNQTLLDELCNLLSDVRVVFKRLHFVVTRLTNHLESVQMEESSSGYSSIFLQIVVEYFCMNDRMQQWWKINVASSLRIHFFASGRARNVSLSESMLLSMKRERQQMQTYRRLCEVSVVVGIDGMPVVLMHQVFITYENLRYIVSAS